LFDPAIGLGALNDGLDHAMCVLMQGRIAEHLEHGAEPEHIRPKRSRRLGFVGCRHRVPK